MRNLIKEGKFRKDLYYRINTLPILVPPLKDRDDDVYLLLEKFKKDVGAEFKFTEKAKEAFKMYNWEGNIRELKNYVEFFNFMDKEYIDFEDMPISIQEYYEKNRFSEKTVGENELLNISGARYKEYLFILKKIEENSRKGESSGRKNLSLICKENEINLSEQEIRGILKNLEKIGYLNVFRGRRGNSISEKGEEFLKKYKLK